MNSLNQEVERGRVSHFVYFFNFYLLIGCLLQKRPSLEDDSEATDIEDNEAADGGDFASDFGLACVVCKGIGTTALNQLFECNECHLMYHQECHKPPITKKDMSDPRLVWYCCKCNKSVKKIGKPMPSTSKQLPPMGKVSGLNMLPNSGNLIPSSSQYSVAHPSMAPKDLTSSRPSFLNKQMSDADKSSSSQLPFKRAPPGKMPGSSAFSPSFAGGSSKATGLSSQSSLNRTISSTTKSASTFSPVNAMASFDKRLNNMKKAKNLKY